MATGAAVRGVGHLLVHVDWGQSILVYNVFHIYAKVDILYNAHLPLSPLCILCRIPANGTATASRTAHVRRDCNCAHRHEETLGEVIILRGAQGHELDEENMHVRLINSVEGRACVICRQRITGDGLGEYTSALKRPCMPK
jgi:hypothetical protein